MVLVESRFTNPSNKLSLSFKIGWIVSAVVYCSAFIKYLVIQEATDDNISKSEHLDNHYLA